MSSQRGTGALRLAGEELRRMLRAPFVPVLAVCCLALNAALMFGHASLRPMMGVVAEVTDRVGTDVEERTVRAIEELPESMERTSLLQALGDVGRMEEGLYGAGGARATAASAIEATGNPLARHLMEQKYRAWEDRVRQVRASGATRDLYAGSSTLDVHDLLFGILAPAGMREAALIGISALFYLAELDERTGAVATVASSTTGRHAARSRLLAATFVAVASYVLLALCTYGAVAVVFGWGAGAAWGSSVSSCFNAVTRGISVSAFVTWVDFTVAGYLAAVVALGLWWVVAMCLAAHVVLTVCRRRALAAALLLAGGAGTSIMLCNLCSMFGCGDALPLVTLGLAPLAVMCGQWFTDMGASALIAWHEIFGVALNLVLGVVLCRVVARWDARRDVVS